MLRNEEPLLSVWLVKQYAMNHEKTAIKTGKINIGLENLPLNLLTVTDIQYWAD
jgi:hypothetical protein